MIKNLAALLIGLVGAGIVIFCAEFYFRLTEEGSPPIASASKKFSVKPSDGRVFAELEQAIKRDRTGQWQHPLGLPSEWEYFVQHVQPRLGPYGSGEDRVISHSAHRERDGSELFDVKYTIENGRRKTTIGSSETKERFVFAGCSYTFGQGVNDEDTFPQRFANLRKTVEVINLGWSGGTITDFIDLIVTNKPAVQDLKDGKRTTIVYSFIRDHISRAICGVDCIFDRHRWKLSKPYLELTENLGVISKGTFGDYFPWNQEWLRRMSETALGRRIGGNVKQSQAQMRRFAGFVAAARKLGKEALGANRFIVLIWPGERIGPNQTIYKELKNYGFEIVNLSRFETHPELAGRYAIPIDGHPSPTMNFAVAWLLDRYLNNIGRPATDKSQK